MLTLTCKRAVALISAALDGKLPLRLRLLLRLHLRACAACARLKTQLMLLRQLVRQRKHSLAPAAELLAAPALSPTARARIKRAVCDE